MKLNFFSNLFKKDNKNKLLTPDSILLKKLKAVCKENNYKLLENTTIYHHSNKIEIPLMILSPKRGLYVLEYKDWTYDDLNLYEITQAKNNEHSKNTLAYDKTNSFINTKYNEILHNDCVKTFNFLIAENLSFVDYEHLSEEKKNLLPNEKIIFCDNDEEEILNKLNDVSEADDNLADPNYILANLLTQYLVLHKGNVSLATDEQIDYITDSQNFEEQKSIVSLNGLALSGKTTALILRAVYLKLLSNNNSVTIIEPTALSCDIVKQFILELIEYSIVNVDITSIRVCTPEEFLNSKVTEYVLCDDTSLIEEGLLENIILKSAKSHLTLVNPIQRYDNFYKLTKSFHNKIDIEFIQNNPYASAMQYINRYATNKDNSILCVSNKETGENLSEDLASYIEDEVILLDSSKKLIDQKKSLLTLSDYKNINAQRSDIVILLDVCEVSQQELSYAINLANEKVFLIYEEQCDAIITLKKIFKKD
ncbi:hypothetical protein [Sulfurimonas sp.]|uniref:hypothetical protein n=1 Tax=Sulfurimonas sp. TaxID=2022749 RepID=UPI0035690F30